MCPDSRARKSHESAGSTAATEPRTETEYLLMIDYLGIGGRFGSKSERLDYWATEAHAVGAAKARLENAGRVEVWSREVPVEWVKVEEFTR